jgi:NADPH:quinone reductase-like Zn-dependent oxidoreductase
MTPRWRSLSDLARANRVEYHGVLTRSNGLQLSAIAKLIDSGVIKPFVSRTYPLQNLAQAFEEVQAGHVRGKIVVAIS